MNIEINKQLCEFLNSHSLISLNALEKKLGIPQSTLSKSLLKKQGIPLKWQWPLILELIDYGFEYYDFTLKKGEIGDISGRKYISTVKEKLNKGLGIHYHTYIVEEMRLHASSIFDL